MSEQPNNLDNNAKAWHKASINDLKCSIVLYEKSYIPQSFYLLHQSIEKEIKSIGLAYDVINNPKGEIGHNIARFFRELSNLADQRLTQTLKFIDKYPRIDDVFAHGNEDFSEEIKDYQNYLDDIESLIQEHQHHKQECFSLSDTEIEQELNYMVNEIAHNRYILEDEFKEFEKEIDEFSSEEILTEMINGWEEILGRDLSQRELSHIEDNLEADSLKKFIKAYYKELFLRETILAILLTLVLVIPEGHLTKGRYPEGGNSPSDTYSDKTIVDYLPEIHRYMSYIQKSWSEILNPEEELNNS